jgi:predicted homoserine dehydrogenase-like protein
MPAARSLAVSALPIGLAHGCRLTRPVRAGDCVRSTDVQLDSAQEIVRTRRDMEARFGASAAAAVAE